MYNDVICVDDTHMLSYWMGQLKRNVFLSKRNVGYV